MGLQNGGRPQQDTCQQVARVEKGSPVLLSTYCLPKNRSAISTEVTHPIPCNAVLSQCCSILAAPVKPGQCSTPFLGKRPLSQRPNAPRPNEYATPGGRRSARSAAAPRRSPGSRGRCGCRPRSGRLPRRRPSRKKKKSTEVGWRWRA